MVRQHLCFLTIAFLFLQRIVQKEVYQNCVDLGLRMRLDDLPPEQLDTPNTAPSQLNFSILTGSEVIEAFDSIL